MTEFGSMFFRHFAVLARHPKYHVRRVYFSAHSDAAFEAWRSRPLWRKLTRLLGAIVRGRRRRVIATLWLLRHGKDVERFDPETFQPMPVDYLCSIGFMRRIPAAQLEMTCTSSNIHWSLLPRHRGCHPVAQALEAGDTETGVTIHRVTDDLDAGDILWQRSIRIPAGCTEPVLHDRLARVSVRGFRTYLNSKARLDEGAQPQVEPESTSGADASLARAA